MTFEAMSNTIRSRFHTLIAVAETVDVHYDNEIKNKPADKIWIRLNILPGQTTQVQIGATYRTVGIVIAQIFLPLGRGTKNLHSMADKVKTAFRAVTVSGVVFRAPSETNVGRTENWWQLNVTIPFYADDTT